MPRYKNLSIPRMVFAKRNALHPRLRILVPGTAKFNRYVNRIRRAWQEVIVRVRFTYFPVTYRIMHTCQLCGKVFNRTMPLLLHLKMHRYNHLIKCGLCGRSFCFLATFKLHLHRMCSYLHWSPNRICCAYHRWPAIKRKLVNECDSESESDESSIYYSSGEVSESDFKSEGITDSDDD